MTHAITTGRVSVVIVTYNCRDIVGRTLDSLRTQTWPDVEVVVVDNQSGDGTAEWITEEYPEVHVERPGANLGFADGNNVGVARTTGEYVFMLNPDAWLEPDTIRILATALAEDTTIGVVGGTVLHEDGTVQENGNLLDRTGFPLPRRGGATHPIDRNVFYIGGCALMLRRADWDRAGGLDGRFFMFAEEVDLCWRIQLLGGDIAVVPDAVIWHVGGATLAGGYAKGGGNHRTSPRRIYLRERNTLAMMLRNGSLPGLGWVALGWIANIAEALGFVVMRQPALAAQYPRALWWNVRQLPHTLRLRRATQRQRVRGHRRIGGWARGSAKVALLRQSGIPRSS